MPLERICRRFAGLVRAGKGRHGLGKDKTDRNADFGRENEGQPGKKAKLRNILLNRASVGRGDRGYFLPDNEIGKSTRFKPGLSGNPSGRPKKSELDYALEDFLASEVTLGKGSRRCRGRKLAARLLAEALFEQALAGKVRVMQLIFERIGGKPKQRINADLEDPTFSDPVARKARIKELQKVLSL